MEDRVRSSQVTIGGDPSREHPVFPSDGRRKYFLTFMLIVMVIKICFRFHNNHMNRIGTAWFITDT